MHIAVRNIAQANVDRFEALLQTETEPTKRAMLVRLIAEEKEKLKAPKTPKEEGDLGSLTGNTEPALPAFHP